MDPQKSKKYRNHNIISRDHSQNLPLNEFSPDEQPFDVKTEVAARSYGRNQVVNQLSGSIGLPEIAVYRSTSKADPNKIYNLNQTQSFEEKSFSKTSTYNKSVALMGLQSEKARLGRLEEKIEALSQNTQLQQINVRNARMLKISASKEFNAQNDTESLAMMSDFQANKQKPRIEIDKEESYLSDLLTDRPQFLSNDASKEMMNQLNYKSPNKKTKYKNTQKHQKIREEAPSYQSINTIYTKQAQGIYNTNATIKKYSKKIKEITRKSQGASVRKESFQSMNISSRRGTVVPKKILNQTLDSITIHTQKARPIEEMILQDGEPIIAFEASSVDQSQVPRSPRILDQHYNEFGKFINKEFISQLPIEQKVSHKLIENDSQYKENARTTQRYNDQTVHEFLTPMPNPDQLRALHQTSNDFYKQQLPESHQSKRSQVTQSKRTWSKESPRSPKRRFKRTMVEDYLKKNGFDAQRTVTITINNKYIANLIHNMPQLQWFQTRLSHLGVIDIQWKNHYSEIILPRSIGQNQIFQNHIDLFKQLMIEQKHPGEEEGIVLKVFVYVSSVCPVKISLIKELYFVDLKDKDKILKVENLSDKQKAQIGNFNIKQLIGLKEHFAMKLEQQIKSLIGENALNTSTQFQVLNCEILLKDGKYKVYQMTDNLRLQNKKKPECIDSAFETLLTKIDRKIRIFNGIKVHKKDPTFSLYWDKIIDNTRTEKAQIKYSLKDKESNRYGQSDDRSWLTPLPEEVYTISQSSSFVNESKRGELTEAQRRQLILNSSRSEEEIHQTKSERSIKKSELESVKQSVKSSKKEEVIIEDQSDGQMGEEEASIIIQSYLRKRKALREVKRMMIEKQRVELEKANARAKELEELIKKKREDSIMKQKLIAEVKQAKKEQKLKESAEKKQKEDQDFLLRVEQEKKRAVEEYKKQQDILRNAAVVIQCRLRTYLAKKQVYQEKKDRFIKKINTNATKIQAFYKAKQVKQKYKSKRNSALKIQKNYRGFIQRKKIKILKQKQQSISKVLSKKETQLLKYSFDIFKSLERPTNMEVINDPSIEEQRNQLISQGITSETVTHQKAQQVFGINNPENELQSNQTPQISNFGDQRSPIYDEVLQTNLPEIIRPSYYNENLFNSKGFEAIQERQKNEEEEPVNREPDQTQESFRKTNTTRKSLPITPNKTGGFNLESKRLTSRMESLRYEFMAPFDKSQHNSRQGSKEGNNSLPIEYMRQYPNQLPKYKKFVESPRKEQKEQLKIVQNDDQDEYYDYFHGVRRSNKLLDQILHNDHTLFNKQIIEGNRHFNKSLEKVDHNEPYFKNKKVKPYLEPIMANETSYLFKFNQRSKRKKSKEPKFNVYAILNNSFSSENGLHLEKLKDLKNSLAQLETSFDKIFIFQNTPQKPSKGIFKKRNKSHHNREIFGKKKQSQSPSTYHAKEIYKPPEQDKPSFRAENILMLERETKKLKKFIEKRPKASSRPGMSFV